jgi:hypothetical protein
MAKVRRCRISWKPSVSDQVVGYKLYWSEGGMVGYDSNFIELGNVNEAYLPGVISGIPYPDRPIRFGITSVDIYGNESDMALLSEPYQITAPLPPSDFLLEPLDQFTAVNRIQKVLKKSRPLDRPDTPSIEKAGRIEERELYSEPRPKKQRVKFYDDVGFRESVIDER